MKEVWKDIEGYEGLYQISNFGNVKSLNWERRGYSKELTPKRHNRGYLFVELFKESKRRAFLIHRLVATAFIPNPSGLQFVNHKDENRKNNMAKNLEWCSENYNVKYSLLRHPERIAKLMKPRRRKCGASYKHIGRVAQCNLNGEIIKIWDSAVQIKHELHFSDWSVAECCRGHRKTAYGYKWHSATENISSRETA